MNKRKNKIIICLLIINIIVLSVLFIIFKDDEVKDYNVYFRQLQGVWGYKDNILEIKDLNNKHIFSEGKYNTEEKKIGIIKNIEEVSHSKYKLEIAIKDIENNIHTSNDENEKIEYVIVEKNNKKNLVLYNNNEYKYVTNDPTNEEIIKAFFNE